MTVNNDISTIIATLNNINIQKKPSNNNKNLFNQALYNQQIIVKKGDTISQLAIDYNTSINDIVFANKLKDPNLILIGQKLKLKNDDFGIKDMSVKNDNQILPTNFTTSNNINKGQKIADFAKQFLGDKYIWGSEKPGAFDCSGLVTYVYKQFGIELPHLSKAQAEVSNKIPTNQAKSGDLLFWQNSQGNVYHVAISLGNGKYISALDQSHGVQIGGMKNPASFAGKVQ